MKTLKTLSAVVVGIAVLSTGTVVAGEFRQARRAALLEKFDTNKDGKLDESERAQLRQVREEKRRERLAQFDANRDGKLDESERARLRETRIAERFDKLDTNNDGMLSIDEFKAGKQQNGRRSFRK